MWHAHSYNNVDGEMFLRCGVALRPRHPIAHPHATVQGEDGRGRRLRGDVAQEDVRGHADQCRVLGIRLAVTLESTELWMLFWQTRACLGGVCAKY